MSEQKIIQGKFCKTKTIGEGKSGKIFEVLVLRDIIYANKGDKLAIKEYKAWVLEEPFQTIRIAREWTTGSKIISNHLVKTYEIIEEQGNTYLVMELLDGISLSKYLENNPILSFPELIDICSGILEGLHQLHKNNLIHRDIKPANIMITSRGPVITDFGVIKDLNESNTITGSNQFLGTIKYAAPELLFGKSKDDKSIDIYSFGMILYELIFKKPYFDKSMYWSEIIILKKNPITFPLFLNSEIWRRFGFRESLFLSSILQGSLTKPDLRLTSEQLYTAFSNNIWKNSFLHYVNSDVISIWPDNPEILKTKLHTLLIKLEKEAPSEIEDIIKNLYYNAAIIEDYGFYKIIGVDDTEGWLYRLSELGLISELINYEKEYWDERVGFMTNLGWQFLLKYSQDVEKLIQDVRINSSIK